MYQRLRSTQARTVATAKPLGFRDLGFRDLGSKSVGLLFTVPAT